MTVLPLPAAPEDLDRALAALPNRPAVFLLWPSEGLPYLARTNVLKRRLTRLLGITDKPSRGLSLRGTAERLEYHLTGSVLEAQFVLLDAARRHLGSDYREAVRLRMPPYVKLILTNQFPRTQIAKQLGRAPAVYFGPFRNRSTAARFEAEFLDLFQLRRCQDDLHPAPEHPGCIYGEMGRCLRPCQQAVDAAEYRSEARRVADFLHTSGGSLLSIAAAARDRYSADLDFEGAAGQHHKLQKIGEVLSLRDEMVRDVNAMQGAAIVPSALPACVEIGFVRDGLWQGFTPVSLATEDGTASTAAPPLDAFLRQVTANVGHLEASPRQRAEHLAILSRWFYSTWCDGELILFDTWEKPPYRKLINAVTRVAQAQAAQPLPRRNTRSSRSDLPPA